MFSDAARTSCNEPWGPSRPELPKEGVGLCKMSLDRESVFDTEELECGGDGVEIKVEVGCNNLWSGVAEASDVGCRSMTVGSEGVWKSTGPVLMVGLVASVEVCAGCL